MDENCATKTDAADDTSSKPCEAAAVGPCHISVDGITVAGPTYEITMKLFSVIREIKTAKE